MAGAGLPKTPAPTEEAPREKAPTDKAPPEKARADGPEPKQALPKAKDRETRATSKPVPTQPTGAAPAGWYPDPAGNPKKIRYWDGEHWTDYFATAPH